jgi:hypothetical protein
MCEIVRKKIDKKMKVVSQTTSIVPHKRLPSYFQEKIVELNSLKVKLEHEVDLLKKKLAQHEKPIQKNDELVELLKELLEKKASYKESFNYKFIKQQIKCALQTTGRAFRWSQTMLNCKQSNPYVYFVYCTNKS